MKTRRGSLPESLQILFWDYNFEALSWSSDRDLIIRRILQAGSWEAVQWLRTTAGDDNLRTWLEVHAGGRLTPRQLRFWELILDLRREQVDTWIVAVANNPWSTRLHL